MYFTEALAVLTKKLNNTEVVGTVDRSYTNILCWRILNSLAVKGQVEKVKQFFDVLEKGRCMDLQNITLSPLVKVHAKRFVTISIKWLHSFFLLRM